MMKSENENLAKHASYVWDLPKGSNGWLKHLNQIASKLSTKLSRLNDQIFSGQNGIKYVSAQKWSKWTQMDWIERNAPNRPKLIE